MTDLRRRREPRFLTVDEVIAVHAHMLMMYKGRDGIRDEAGLLSAVHQPQATFDSAYLHNSLFEQAAAYLFHISQNQPFVDGNKRTATTSALMFLMLNHHMLVGHGDELFELVMRVSTKQASKPAVAEFFAERATPMVLSDTFLGLLQSFGARSSGR